jgi:transposase-like protein
MARKKYSASFKFNVVREAIEGERSDAEIAREHDIHPVTLANWKKKFYSEGAAIFEGDDALKEKDKEIARLERMLGKKEVELALIKNFLPNR